MQLAGALLLAVIVAYLAWRDGLLSTASSAASAPGAAAPAAAPTAFPSGITIMQPVASEGAPAAAIPAFKALPPPLLTFTFCTS